MRALFWALLRWAPFVAGLWWAALHYPWYVTSILAVVVLLLPHYPVIVTLGAVVVALWPGVPLGPLAVAAGYRLLYEIPLHRVFTVRPVRLLGISPRLRCHHGARAGVRRADSALLAGRSATALDLYLQMLAAHSRTDSCVRPLLGRAAEAALRSGCPQLAAELAAGAVVSAVPQPLGRRAVRVARAHALRARALNQLGDAEGAGAALRLAQQLPHRDRRAQEAVRTAAAEVHLYARRLSGDYEAEVEAAAEVLRPQQVKAGSQRAMIILYMAIGRRLALAGNPGEAASVFGQAAAETGVYAHARLTSTTIFTWWRIRLAPRWRGAVRLWLEALTEEMRCLIETGQPPDGESRTVYRSAANLVGVFEDPLLTARLRTYRDCLERRATAAERTASDEPSAQKKDKSAGPRHAAETRPFVFADPVAQREWARLQEEARAWAATDRSTAAEPVPLPTGAVADSGAAMWWEGWYSPDAARSSARAAEELFARLSAVLPEVFRPIRTRMAGSQAAPIAPAGTVSQPVPLGPAEPDRPGSSEASAGAPTSRRSLDEAGVTTAQRHSADGDRMSPSPRHEPEGAGTSTAMNHVSVLDAPAGVRVAGSGQTGVSAADALRDMALPVQPAAWLREADRLTTGRCWPLMSAVAEAYGMRHARVASGHLLLVLLDDPVCARLTEACGLARPRLRRALSALYGPADTVSQEVPVLAGETRTALQQARMTADRHGERDLHPLRLLDALLRPEQAVLAELLRALGADPDEARVRVRHCLDQPTSDPASLPWIRWSGGRPDLSRLTPAARRVLTAAAVQAASTTGLLGPDHLRNQLRAVGETKSGPPAAGHAGARCVVTPGARRVLDAAEAAARAQGHPGVDVEHVMAAVNATPPNGIRPADPAVLALTADASAIAHRAKSPYVGPEHLAAALGTAEPAPAASPIPVIPLPLTPLCAQVLATAASGRTSWGVEDVAGALASLWKAPGEPDREDRSYDKPLTGLIEAHTWHQAVAVEARRTVAALATERMERVRAAHARWTQMLCFLTRIDPERCEPRLADELVTAAQYLGPGPAAARTLQEAEARARTVASRAEDGQARLARSLAEIAACQSRLGMTEEARRCYERTALALRTPQPLWVDDRRLDELLGLALLRRAECLVAPDLAPDPAVAAAALLEAAGHQLTVAADGDEGQRTAAVRVSLTVLGHLDALGEKAAALDVATRTLRLFDGAATALGPVHQWRADLLWELDREDLGLSDLAAAGRLAPEDPYPLLRHGVFLQRVRRTDEAVSAFRQAAALDPGYAAARTRLGQALVLQGRYDEALSLLDGEWRSASLLARARALRAVGRTEQAWTDLRVASASTPDIPWYRYQYGLALLEAGDERRGRLQIGAAIRLELEQLDAIPAWYGVGAANLAVYCAALGGLRPARTWYAAALTAMRHPWSADELLSDLGELAAIRPGLAPLVQELTRGTVSTSASG